MNAGMQTMFRNKPKSDRQHTHNGRLMVAIGIGGAIALAAFNLDLPAETLIEAGRADLATPCLELMTTFHRELHIRDVREANALSLLSRGYAQQQRLADAVKVQQLAVNAYREANGSDSTEALTATATLVKLLNQDGSFVRSELLLEDALQISQRKPVCDVVATALLNDALAETFLEQNKTSAALKVLEQLQPIDESYMRLKQRSIDSADKLAALYEQLGRSNLGRQTLEQGLALKERILGAQHPQVLATKRRIASRDQQMVGVTP